MRGTVATIAFVALFTAAGQAGAQQTPSASHLQAAAELVKLLDIEAQHLKQLDRVMGAATPLGENPLGTVMQDFMKEFMPWEKLEAEHVRAYAEQFSEAELRELIAFYRSPIGRKMVERMPAIMDQMMEFTQNVMMENMPELQRRIMQRIGGGN